MVRWRPIAKVLDFLRRREARVAPTNRRHPVSDCRTGLAIYRWTRPMCLVLGPSNNSAADVMRPVRWPEQNPRLDWAQRHWRSRFHRWALCFVSSCDRIWIDGRMDWQIKWKRRLRVENRMMNPTNKCHRISKQQPSWIFLLDDESTWKSMQNGLSPNLWYIEKNKLVSTFPSSSSVGETNWVFFPVSKSNDQMP